MNRFVCTVAFTMILLPCPMRAAEKADNAWNETVDKAIAYLRSTQKPDGSWSSPGVTGIIVTGLLRTGKATPADPMVQKALSHLAAQHEPKEGHLAGKDARPQLLNYVTSVNLMALKAANTDGKYDQLIKRAVDFLKGLQWDEKEGKDKSSDFFGGAGYDSKSRPDLSNTQFFLEALHEAGLPPDDPALKNALIFVSRCQNLKSEYNDQPWAGKIDDGSFIYSAAGGGQTKSETLPDGALVGYGSMTYAGIKSMIYCGVDKNDQRIKKGFDWIRKNYQLERNPGMPPGHDKQGLFYYYHTLSKCLAVMDVDQLEDAKGEKHDWRAELLAVLQKQQGKDGSFVNSADPKWMEGDPDLATGFVLMALGNCRKP